MESQGRPGVITLKNVSKSFGDTTILNLDFLEIKAGRILGLLGHNGSGKSTLIKILSGVYLPDSGECVLPNGDTVSFPLQRRRDIRIIGIHQDLGLWDELTVTENILAKWQPLDTDTKYGRLVKRSGRIQWSVARNVAAEVLDELGFQIDVRRKVLGLSSSERAAIAVARGYLEGREFRTNPEILSHSSTGGSTTKSDRVTVVCFDETSSYFHRDERLAFHDLARNLVANGLAVVVISHDLDEVDAMADDFYVLRDGKCAGRFCSGEMQQSELLESMFGSTYASDHGIEKTHEHNSNVVTTSRVKVVSHSDGTRQRQGVGVRPALECKAIVGDGIGPLNFHIEKGEILGVTGLAGSGYEKLAYCLGGAGLVHDGEIRIAGQTLPLDFDCADALKRGIVLIPGDRQIEGGFQELSLRDNAIAPDVICARQDSRFGWHLNWRSFQSKVGELITAFEILPADPEARFWRLSGGNQQKAIVARWLRMNPQVMVMVEPTLGVDVAARSRIHQSMRDFADSQGSILIASSDLDELTTVADRVIGLRNGVSVFELAGSEISKVRLEELVVL